MRRSLRGRRSAALILFVGLSLASVPCGGVGPLAFLAKEIVQGLVRSLIEDALHATLMAALGPCDGALVSGSLSVAQGLAAMRPEERSEHVALMLAERQQWSEEEDETFVAMLKSDLLGMPPDMRAALERAAR